MIEIEVRTQAELDAAVERQEQDGEVLIVVVGDGYFVVTSGAPTIVNRGQSAATIVNRGQSAARIVNWGQSAARIENWEQSAARIENREQSAARIDSYGRSRITGSAVGRWSQPRFFRHSDEATIDIPGAVILEAPEIKTAEVWLDYYGVEVRDGVATLFKAVGDDYVSSRGFAYRPGSEPECEDWNPDPAISCGQGLHFCPAPSVALGYRGDATKFVACPVAVADIVVTEQGRVPDKVRAPMVAGPVWECDIDGEKVESSK